MSADTDPIWTLFLWLGILTLLAYILADRLITALAWLDRRNAEHDQQAAADHGEPTREQVEWEAHIAEAIELTQDDIDAIVAWDELEFTASVMADIDDLPGGAA